MPLPASNSPWPPKALDTVRPKLVEWSAWYSGSPDALRGAYRATRGAATIDRPSQYQGGIVGAAARTFWGKPVGDLTQQRTQLHVPIAADLCQTSADLLFAEPPTITVDDQTTQDRLSELLDDGLHTTLAEAAEVGAALGGVFVRVNWDTAVMPDRPFLTAVHADAAAPEFRWNRLMAVTFWWVLSAENQVVLRHLERHELDAQGNGIVLHGLYQGTSDSLGQQLPLTEHPATAGLAQLVAEDGGIDEGRTPGLLVEYVPNQRPQRRWRNDPTGAPLGRSDLDGIEPLMDALDEAYSSLMRDLRLAKARLVVSDTMLDNLGPGQGAAFDLDREVFSPVKAAPQSIASSSLGIEKVQFAIRVQEHLQIMQQLTEDILRSSGYSTQTFGEAEDGGAQTATEVTAKDRRSNMTRDRKIRLWRPATTRIVTKLLLTDAALFNKPHKVDGLSTSFAESAQADPEMLARTSQMLRAAEAASTETLVQINHPEWDDEQVQAEVGRILAESGRFVPDPIGDGEQNPDEPPAGTFTE